MATRTTPAKRSRLRTLIALAFSYFTGIWGICALLFCGFYFVYPRDAAKLRQAMADRAAEIEIGVRDQMGGKLSSTSASMPLAGTRTAALAGAIDDADGLHREGS